MNDITRLQFASQVCALIGVTLLGGQTLGAVVPAEALPPSGSQLLGHMKWLNQPASATVTGERLVLRARRKTDFWRKTFYGYVTDNGHFLHLPVSGDFSFEARIDGEYAALYDQAGLIVRIDAQNWAKCGSEFFRQSRHASVVFTREFSDRPTMNNLAVTGPVRGRVVRKPDSLETLCSGDGKNFISVRMGYLVACATAEVGIMCAGSGGRGISVRLRQF